MFRSDNRPWLRKHDGDNPAVPPGPELRCYPTSLDELMQVVASAETGDPRKTKEVRASGSHWALSKAAVTSRLAAETQAPENVAERLNKTLYDVVPDS